MYKHYISIIIGVVLISVLVACSDPIIEMVKGGKLESCPTKTLDEMVLGFMGSPSWESGTAEDGSSFVNVSGDITYHEKPIKARLQFIVNEEDSTFEFNAMEFNGIPQMLLLTNALLTKMCET